MATGEAGKIEMTTSADFVSTGGAVKKGEGQRVEDKSDKAGEMIPPTRVDETVLWRRDGDEIGVALDESVSMYSEAGWRTIGNSCGAGFIGDTAGSV